MQPLPEVAPAKTHSNIAWCIHHNSEVDYWKWFSKRDSSDRSKVRKMPPRSRPCCEPGKQSGTLRAHSGSTSAGVSARVRGHQPRFRCRSTSGLTTARTNKAWASFWEAYENRPGILPVQYQRPARQTNNRRCTGKIPCPGQGLRDFFYRRLSSS